MPSSRARPPADVLARLEAMDLDALRAEHPAVWQEVGARLVEATKGGPDAIEAFVRRARADAAPWRERLARSHGNPEVLAAALPHLAAARMAHLAARRTLQTAATGVESGRVRFGLFSGWMVQRLLFARGLERKPASLGAFRLLWPLIPQRRLLMPLVQPQGIWCFYSRAFVRGLARRIGDRPTLEVGAGDGTLTRFLAAEGVDVRATDDRSWARPGGYPDEVEAVDAAEAVARDRPRVVVCGFPPPGNRFERRILRVPSVELYVAIVSHHRGAAGDWAAYEAAEGFSGGVDAALSKQVLPPELAPAVVVLERPGPDVA